jgi:D-alanyl-D-alanine carboxypeptidase (penicillin-binding protein 5/6)
MGRNLFLLGALAVLAGCASVTEQATEVRRAEPAPPPVAAPLAVLPAGAPEIHARSAIMIDARTGRTLYEKNADSPRQVASTQKLVTALLVLERGDLDGRFTIAAQDTRVEPSRLGFKAGQSYTRRQILTAMMVKSENDAAAALARDHSGSIPAFARAMNRKAWSLGARSSHFVNPHGLPAPQYSTARDMARIAFQAYREPALRRMMCLPSYTFVFSNGRSKTLEATNKLLGRSLIFNGMKTGYTNAAGRCLIASASSGGREVILVQLGSKTSYIFDDADRMLRWGLARATGPMFY